MLKAIIIYLQIALIALKMLGLNASWLLVCMPIVSLIAYNFAYDFCVAFKRGYNEAREC